MRQRTTLLAAFLAILALAPVWSSGDWLVLKDGSRVETTGDGWEVEGRLVVFEMKDGTRASLRLSDVDLETSRKATAAATARTEASREAAAEPGDEEPRRANRKITNADIPSGRSRPEPQPEADDGSEQDDGAEAADPKAEGATAAQMRVTTWEQVEDDFDGHLLLRGRVVNPTSATATGTRIIARVYGYDGELLATRRAERAITVPAQGAASFELDLVDVFEFLAIEFEVEARMLATAPEGFETETETDEADDEFYGSSPER